MKKFFLIFIPIILIVLLSWFFLRTSDSPVAETLREGLPFGIPEDINIPSAGNTADTVGQETSFDQGVSADTKVFRIANIPVAGFTILTRGNDAIVRYVDRATGHISDFNLKTGERAKISNQTLPKIYEAYFNQNGNSVLIRSLEGDSLKNMTLTLTPPRSASLASTSSPQATELYGVSATSLRGEMGSVTVGASNIIYTLLDSGNIVSGLFNGSSPRTLFSSAFTDWRLSRLGNNLLVSTKASVGVAGYAYSLPVGGGGLSRLLGPLNGLSAVASPTGGLLLYSYFGNGQAHLFTKNVARNTVSEILPATLAEKCVWSSKKVGVFFCGTPINGLSGAEPDNWYLGRSHFTDYLWQFDTNAEIAKLIAEPKTEFALDLDISEPKLSPNEDFLLFINRRDLTLWAVRL